MRAILFILSLCLSWPASANTITAKSWLVADGNGQLLKSENSNEVRAIASITKLMTAMVVLDSKQELSERVSAHTRRDLLKLAIVRSDNNAADALCRHYPTGYHSCIKDMNKKAQSLGLYNTRFVDATGLGVFNVSTAEDLVKLVIAAKEYPEIVEDSKSPQIKIQLRKKWFVFNNTNPIIGKRHDFIVSKTGYIKAAGGCIVMMLDTDVGRRIVVVLGSRDTRTRIPEAEFIGNLH